MKQGTTPTHIFLIPFDTSTITNLAILYAQGDSVILRKELADCTLEGQEIKVTLTQEETFLFDNKKDAKIQLHVLVAGENALVSDIYTVSVDKCLDDEVLT